MDAIQDSDIIQKSRAHTKRQIVTKMREQHAASVHDLEIWRCLRKCVMGTKLIQVAKNMRDRGELTNSDLHR